MKNYDWSGNNSKVIKDFIKNLDEGTTKEKLID